MDVRERLEERVRFCTRFPEYRPRRAVLCVWDGADRAADGVCTRLQEEAYVRGVFLRITRKNMREALRETFAKLEGRVKKGELSFTGGLYALVVGASHELCDALGDAIEEMEEELYFEESVIEYCRLMAGRAGSEESRRVCSGTEWRVAEDDIGAVAALVMYAACGDRLLAEELDPGGYEGRVFSLHARQYSAIREGMCRRLIASLRKQTEESGITDEAARAVLSIRDYRTAIRSACPVVTDLPVLDTGRFPRWRPLTRYALTRETRRAEREIALGEALAEMFGMEGDRLRPEWLRSFVSAKTLREACRGVLSRNRTALTEKVRQNFSLYDICHTLSGRVLGFQEQPKEEMGRLEEKIRETLEQRICLSWRIEETFEALGAYISLWEKWLDACMEYRWWEQTAAFIQSVRTEAEADYRKLLSAQETLEGLCISGTEPLSFVRQEPAEHISDADSLMDAIHSGLNFDSFSAEDLLRLVRWADRRYADSDYFHVDENKRPTFFLLYSGFICLAKVTGELYFRWHLRPVAFLPRCDAYELVLMEME